MYSGTYFVFHWNIICLPLEHIMSFIGTYYVFHSIDCFQGYIILFQCMSCFSLSDHTGHDVKMCTAGGGGVCDCGDNESWAIEGTCSKHRPDINEEVH